MDRPHLTRKSGSTIPILATRIRHTYISLALLGVAAASEFSLIPHKDCKSLFKVKSLEASECQLKEVEVKGETKTMCSIKSGSKPTIRISFTSTEEGVEGLETSVRAKFGSSTLPYSMTDFDTCTHGGIQCPLKKDADYQYSQTFHVDPSYPKGELFQVNWVLGKGEARHVCVVFLAKIEH